MSVTMALEKPELTPVLNASNNSWAVVIIIVSQSSKQFYSGTPCRLSVHHIGWVVGEREPWIPRHACNDYWAHREAIKQSKCHCQLIKSFTGSGAPRVVWSTLGGGGGGCWEPSWSFLWIVCSIFSLCTWLNTAAKFDKNRWTNFSFETERSQA